MTITLAVTKRDESIKTEVLRTSSLIPAVIYGPKQVPLNITLDEQEFDKIRKVAGESTIVELTGLEKSIEVLVKDIDFNPVKQRVMHVDFYAIERGKEMTANVALHFIGEAPVEQAKNGSVSKIIHEVEVVCLPANLPSNIDVDLSVLVTVEDRITIGDLKVGTGVKISAEADEVVVIVAANKEAEEDAESVVVDMDAITAEKKGKKETE
ncbi:MAG: hypothetical protein RLZZ230_70 [Candidatus Parcubacteria bacterium]|jgi:large subunit ribosomal protein L25